MRAETVVCKLYETRTNPGYTQREVADGADVNVRTGGGRSPSTCRPLARLDLLVINFSQQNIAHNSS